MMNHQKDKKNKHVSRWVVMGNDSKRKSKAARGGTLNSPAVLKEKPARLSHTFFQSVCE